MSGGPEREHMTRFMVPLLAVLGVILAAHPALAETAAGGGDGGWAPANGSPAIGRRAPLV